MGPLFSLSSNYWRGLFRNALMGKKIIYSSLPSDEAGTGENETWYRRYRAAITAVMVSAALALVSFLAWSLL